MSTQNANAVAITGGTATLTSLTTPTVQATNSAGLALKNSGGTTQISMGAGGGDNISLNSSTNINGTNAQIDISPTGTGHVHIKPTGVNSVEIAPTYVGEMDNITIGSITPKAGTFTTITGQTEVLKGTGSNLITYSQLIGGTNWTFQGTVAVTTNSGATTDPLGGNTASLISGATDVVFNGNSVKQLDTVSGNIAYTYSVYIKAGTATTMQIALRDNSTGSLPTTTLTPTSSWQRVSVSLTSGSGTSSFYAILGGANGTFYAWGAQLEIGSVANTYIPTTTTAIYGTPTLSFSGVAGLGLESNGALYVSPAGTGAIQAQATTSSTVGGNARGANAVDWQTSRGSAGQVASGTYSTVSGGQNNTASGYASFAAGANSVSSSTYTFVGSGTGNTASGYGASIVAGYSNTAAGYFNFIGNGYTNSGTALAAVTTQSGTMNGTTTVTLSGSNANIKVGQLITGTSINSFPNTYVAAISGTSLTLSQAASGSSTSTLSFFTPHGVVVGGGNNQATGSYSFIGGGGDAGTAANRNVASGDFSVVVGGIKNTASGLGSVVCGGGIFSAGSYFANTASNIGAFVGGGTNNTANQTFASIVGGLSNISSGIASFVYGGDTNTASGNYSSLLGGTRGTTRAINGNSTFASANPLATSTGATQSSLLVLGIQTTDATATALRSDASAASGTNQVILPNNSAYFFRGEVVSGVTGGGDTKGWTIEGVIKRGAGVGTTTLVGVTVTSMYADLGAATWTIGVTADTTNGGLRVTFTGQAATTIRTVCQIRTTEMTY
jgi:hypothetical protein